jgi:hypothetical protein
MIGYVTLPSNFVSLVSANAGTIFSDLAPVAMLIAGVMLGLFVINWVIRAIRGKSNYDEMVDWETRYHGESQDDWHDDSL